MVRPEITTYSNFMTITDGPGDGDTGSKTVYKDVQRLINSYSNYRVLVQCGEVMFLYVATWAAIDQF